MHHAAYSSYSSADATPEPPKNSIVNFHKPDLFQKYSCDIPEIAPNKVPFSRVFPRLMG
jgi:hypothetical protein